MEDTPESEPMPDHESASAMNEDTETPTDTGGWQVDRLGVRRAANGGFIVIVSRTRKAKPGKGGGEPAGPGALGSNYEDKDFAFSSYAELETFMREQLGG